MVGGRFMLKNFMEGSFLNDCCYVTKILRKKQSFSSIRVLFYEEKIPLDLIHLKKS